MYSRLSVMIFVFALFVAGCMTAPLLHEKKMVVAVWDLDDLSAGTGNQHHDLEEILSATVLGALQETGKVTIVERERLLLVLEELNIGISAITDESTRLKAGKLAGANFMVFGGYQVIGSRMRIDLRMVDVETGEILNTAKQIVSANDLSECLKAAHKAALRLL